MNKILTILFCIFFCGMVVSQETPAIKELDSYIAEAVKAHQIPGLAVGIIKDNQVVLAKGYGLRKAGQNNPVTTNSTFAIASCSKAFTAACLAMLVEEGKVKWEDKAMDYVPEFRLSDPYITSQLTIADLLCHRSGLATFDGDLLIYGTDYQVEDVIRRIKYRPVSRQFRSEFGYQNIMYVVAGQVIKNITGLSWEDFVTERIFQPLAMNNTTAAVSRLRDNHELALPHIKGIPMDYQNNDGFGPAGSINSNVDDVLKWLQLFLNEGKMGEQQLLAESSLELLLSAHTNLPVRKSQAKSGIHFSAYGLGWFLMDYAGHKVAHHGGGLPGFISKVAIVPEKNLGMVILTNDMNPLPSALMMKILDSWLKNTEKDWAGEALKSTEMQRENELKRAEERRNARVKNTLLSHSFSDYAGTYEDPMYGIAEVIEKNGKLFLSLEPSKLIFTSEMEHWHYDSFRIKFRDPFLPEGWVTFNLDSNGDISGFKIDLPNPDFHFYKLNFDKLQ